MPENSHADNTTAVDIAIWNDQIVAEVRASNGYATWSTHEEFAAGRPVPPWTPGMERLGWDRQRGMPLILVHHIGAKTGRRRISPLFYQAVGDDWAVFGTHGGSAHHPAWYRNLLADPHTTVETGAASVPVVARLTQGAERELIWTKQVARVPKFAEFQAAAGREIPVVVLERTSRRRTSTGGPSGPVVAS